MKAHVTVLDPQKAYKEVISNADLTGTGIYLAFRYFVMQMMEETAMLDQKEAAPTDGHLIDCLHEALENTNEFMDDTYGAVVDMITTDDPDSEDGDYTVNFNGTVEELREMLNSMTEHEMAENLERKFISLAEMTTITRTNFEWQVAAALDHTIKEYGSIEKFFFGDGEHDDEHDADLNTTPVSGKKS